jgi:hypothetical protein
MDIGRGKRTATRDLRGAGGRTLTRGLDMADAERVATRKTKPRTPTAHEVPVTRKRLAGVRTEARPRTDQARGEPRAADQKLDEKIDALRSEIRETKAGMLAMQAQLARIEALVEDQHAWNKIVFDTLRAVLRPQGGSSEG